MTNKHQVVEVSSQYMAEAAGKTVPAGYKQSEVGVIPKEWSVSEIENLNLKNFPAVKAGPFGSALTKEVYVKTGYKIYGQEQVIKADHEYGDYFIDEVKFRQLKSCEVTDGDILLSLVGTAGKLLVIPPNAQKGIINPRLLRFRFDKTKVNSDYFRYFFESDYIQNYLSSAAQGGTMAVLNAGMLKSLQIPLPKIKEQTAIANALSDVDALINELEKLIAKKQAIKTATMQQLLTGRTRLPQFDLREDGTKKGYKQSELGEIPEDWEAIEFGSVLKEFRNGFAFSAKGYTQEGIPIITMAQIGLSGNFQFDSTKVSRWSEEQFNNLKEFWVRDGDLLIAMTDVTPDKNLIGQMAIAKLTEVALLNQRVGLLRINDQKGCSEYFSYLSCLPIWKTYCKGVASLGVQANIGTTDIKKALVPLPTAEEQTAIATILSDMDADIQTLQQRLSKTRQIKQGMMQELLTGLIRLVS